MTKSFFKIKSRALRVICSGSPRAVQIIPEPEALNHRYVIERILDYQRDYEKSSLEIDLSKLIWMKLDDDMSICCPFLP